MASDSETGAAGRPDDIGRRLELATALNEINAAIASPVGVDEMMGRVVALSRRALHADQTAVAVLDPQGWTTRWMEGSPSLLLGLRLERDGYPLGVLALESGEPVAVSDVASDPRTRPELAAKIGVVSALVIPLFDRDRPMGVLFFNYQAGPVTFGPAELDFAKGLGGSVSLALETARLFEAEQRRAMLAESLNEINRLVHATRDADGLLRGILQLAVAGVGADSGFVALAEGDSWMIDHAASDDGSEGDRLLRCVVQARDSGQPVLVQDGGRELVEPGRTDARWGTAAVVPVFARGEFEGAVVLTYSEPHLFSDAEIDYARKLCTTLSLALENARLYGELDESRARVETILDSIGDAFFSLDREYRFTWMNPASERILGVRSEAVLGKCVWDVFPDAVGTTYYDEYHRVMEQSVSVAFEEYYPALDLWTEVRAYPSADGMSVYFTDIGARKAAEAQLRDSRERADTFAMLLEDSSQPFMVGSPDGRFILFNKAYEELTGYSADELVTLSWPDGVTTPETLPLELTVMEEIARTGQPARYEKEFLRKDGVCIPVEALRHVKRDATGAPEYFYAFFTDLSQRKAAEAKLEAERARLRQIIDEVPIGVSVVDAEGRVLEVNEASKRIWATDKVPEDVRGYARYVGTRHGTGERMGPEDWPPVVALKRHEHVDALVDIVRFDGGTATVHIASTPIGDAVREVARVITVTRDVTRELETQRLTEALNSIGSAISATLDSDQVLHRLADLAAEALGAEAATLALKKGDGWVFSEAFGVRTGDHPGLADDQRELVLLTIGAPGPVVISDTERDSRLDARVMQRLGIRSVMAVPLKVQGATVAVLIFEHLSPEAAFTVDQVDFAAKLMVVATLALENARLYERERRIADTLQEAILTPPEPMPGVETAYLYRPASTTANIGGDFYDVFAIGPDRVGIVIGDVSGKGLDAARLTSLLHHGMRAYVYEDADPARALARLNALVLRSTPTETFASGFLGVLEPSTGTLRYCTAGHPPPAVIGSAHAWYLDGSRSPVLGVLEDAVYTAGEAVLSRGETLVLYTDGVTEARRERDLFGEKRLLAALEGLEGACVADLPGKLLAEVLSFAGGHLSDDTVILAVGLE